MARVRMPGLLDGELQEVARLRVRAGQYQLSADDVSQATLTIPEDGPVVGLRDWVSLYDVDGLMGVYRVTNIAQTVKRSIQLTLLHGIDILADSYWAEEREYTGNVRGYLEALLAQQTALIDGTAPWALGDCEDTETTLKVKISYGRLSELIREAVPEGGGYQLEYDQTVWPWRVHLRAKPTAAAAEFRVARNITSATITYNDADLCTRLILSNTSGGESRVRVYNAGAIAQAEWGIVTKTASIDTSDTLTSESWPEAEAWVAEFFRQHAAPSVQIQIEGRELYRLTGDRWDRASLGRVCRVSLPEYGHTFEERVVALTYPDPWGDLDRVVVSLANALPQFSEQVKLIEKTARSASRAAGGAARKADQTAEELERREVIYQTSFQKTDREIAGIASATGLQFNADGTPVLDEDGNFVYSETHPDNALIAQISLQAGRYDRIIQATGISETPSQGEVSLVTQISQTHQQISNAAIATGLIWVEGDPDADPPTEGHYEVNEGAVASSLYKQLANQIDQKVTASDLESKVSTAGFIKLQAAKDAASAVLGANLTDGNGQITAATIVAAIKDNTSLISAIADKITISASKVNISGNVNLNDVITVGSGGAVGTFNSLTINGGANLGSSNVYYNNVPLSSFIKSISLTGPSNNVYTLTWENAGGTPTSKTFSRAASGVSVSWSGTQGTVTVQPQNQQFSITYDGPSGQSVDAITITNTPVTGTLYTGSGGTRYSQADLDLAAWHNNEDETQTQLKTQTAQLRMNIESILSSAESTAAANALGNVTVSGTWSGGKITIANSANSNTIVDYLRAGTATWNGTTVTVPVLHSTTPDTTASFADTGQSVSVNVSGKLYNPGTITPTSSAQTISVPSGYIGFAGPLSIAAASGDGDTDTGWNAAADYLSDHLVAPSSPGGAYSILGPLAGGYGDTGTVKTLYLVDDSLHSRMLLKDVNSLSSGNTFASSGYVATPEEGQTYEDGWADALATVELERSPDTSSPSYSQTVNVTAKAKATPSAASKTAISGASTSITAPDAPSGSVTVTAINKYGTQSFSSDYKTVYVPVRATYSDGTYSSSYTVSCGVADAYNKGKTDGITKADIITTNARKTSDPGSQDANFTLTYPYYVLTVTVGSATKTIRLSIPSLQ